MIIFHQCPRNSSLTTLKTLMLKSPISTHWDLLRIRHSALDMIHKTNTLLKDVTTGPLKSITHSQANNLTSWTLTWKMRCQRCRSDGDQELPWLSPRMSSSVSMPMVLWRTGTPPQVSCFTRSTQESVISSSPSIIIMMEPNSSLPASLGVYRCSMSRRDSKLSTSRVVVQVNQVTVIEFSAASLMETIQILLSLEVGTRMSKSGILDNQVHADQFMDHIFVVIQLIFMMALCWQGLIRILSNFNCGTSEPVSILKISIGTKVFHLISLVLSTHLNSKRTLVILLSQEVQAPTRSKYLMRTTCSSLVPRSEDWVELPSQ